MTDPQLTPSLHAALLLLARDHLPGDAPRTVEGIMALTGAGKSQAYELRNRLRELLPTVLSAPGRPFNAPPEPKAREAVLVAVRDYLIAHPGSVFGAGVRKVYSDGFRRFVLGLQAPGQPGERLSEAELADAVGIPFGTLKDWLRIPSLRPTSPPAAAPPEPAPATPSPDSPEGASPPRP